MSAVLATDKERIRWIANLLTVIAAPGLNDGQRALRMGDAFDTAYLMGRTDALRERLERAAAVVSAVTK